MAFSNPSTAVGIEIETGKYYVKVVSIEDQPEGQFGPQILWKFELATLDGAVVLDDRGFNAEFWQWSTPKISTGGKRSSKAYEWGTALLPGVDLMTLTGEQFGTMIIGTKAMALIGPNENGNTSILNMSPMPAKNGAAPKTATKAAAPTAVQTPPEEPPDDVAAIEASVAEAEAAAAPW